MNLLQKLFCENKTEPKLTIGRHNRDFYIYQEGERKMIIHAEPAGDESVLIHFRSIWNWLPPHDNNGFGLPFNERERILGRFCRYLEAHRTKYTVS